MKGGSQKRQRPRGGGRHQEHYRLNNDCWAKQRVDTKHSRKMLDALAELYGRRDEHDQQ